MSNIVRYLYFSPYYTITAVESVLTRVMTNFTNTFLQAAKLLVSGRISTT